VVRHEDLHKANRNKKDEFYTTYDVIQAELNYYTDKFKDKTVLCNCDNPLESNFCKFFLTNFNFLNLKRLICTSYSGSPVIGKQMSLFDENDQPVNDQHGYVMDINHVPIANGRGITEQDIDRLLHQKNVVKKLKGNGDFRSVECINYLKQADIVVTNEPFSLFREYIQQLIDYNKKFLIIGNINAIKYKKTFPLFLNNQVWLGASIHSGDREFKVPDDYPLKAANSRVDETGNKYIRVKGVRWITNLKYKQRHEGIPLYKKYNPAEYPKYDNYDAIEVSKTADIPMDYPGVMGVPITFIDKYNPDQFELLGMTSGRREFSKKAWPTKRYINAIQHKSNGKEVNGININTSAALRVDDPKGHTFYTADNLEGKVVMLYTRFLIRNKKVKKG
jgi:hypothetical protein